MITPSNFVQRMTRQNAELEKECLTFAFALAYAAAQAGPKSGSSGEPTYNSKVSISAKVKLLPCVTHRRGVAGVDNAIIWGYWVIRRYREGRKSGRLYWDTYLSFRGRARRG